MKRMGKNKKMSRIIKPLMKMYRVLEEECQRDYAVAKVLERVEAAEVGVGRLAKINLPTCRYQR